MRALIDWLFGRKRKKRLPPPSIEGTINDRWRSFARSCKYLDGKDIERDVLDEDVERAIRLAFADGLRAGARVVVAYDQHGDYDLGQVECLVGNASTEIKFGYLRKVGAVVAYKKHEAEQGC